MITTPSSEGNQSPKFQAIENQALEYQRRINEANQSGSTKEAKKWQKKLKLAQRRLENFRSGSY